MLFILNRQEKVINILKNYGNNSSLSPYFDDSLVEMLSTGAETFSFSTVAQGNLFKDLVVGNYVAFKKGQNYKLFQIMQVETRHDSEMIISVYCECAGLDLINKLFRARKINSCSLRKFIDTITEETGWNTGIIDATLLKTFDLDLEDDTVYATLQNNISKFEGEIEFRVELKNGQISNKFIDVYANRGKVTGKRFVFGKDIEGITRTVDSTSLYTALKGVGKNSLSFKGIEIEGIDKPVGQDFVADQEAYERYNNNGYHIMGLFEYDTESPEELLRETYKQLQKVKEPKVTYEIPIALLADLLGKDWEKVNIGDTVSIFDNAFNPPLMLMARVSQLETSETNPYANNCTFTNFIEVSSNITDEMRKLASKLEGYVDNNIQSKFPIGSSDIQDGAVGMDKISDIYTQTITTDILKAGKVETEKLIAKEAEITDAKIENLKAGTIEADKVIADSIVAVEGKFDKVTAGLVEADKVIADSIVAVEGKFDKVNAGLIEADKVIASLVEADKVIADTVKANKGEFDVLEAQVGEINNLISGNISSENIQTGGITGDNLNMKTIFVKDANILDLSASKLTAGEIDTSKIVITSNDGGMRLVGSTQQFIDENDRIRIQLGKDAKGDFDFYILAENGDILFNTRGITGNAIENGLIKEDMVSDGAIGGKKINWQSFTTEFNKDSNTHKLNSSKVLLDGTNQTLDIHFNRLNSTVNDNVNKTESNTTQLNVHQGKINTLIQDTTITKDGKNVKLKDEYSKLEQTVGGLKSTVGEQQTTINQNTGKITATESKVSTLEQTVNGFNSELSHVKTTIDEQEEAIGSVNSALGGKANSSDVYKKSETMTTSAINSAINQSADSIKLGISETYETKTNVETKVTTTLNSAKNYADTKKQEAISTASSDATNKVNSAKNELNTAIGKKANSVDVYTKTETYTKSETDSKIKVAKDEINLGVSSTYETKTNVENKISSANTTTLNSAKSYADTKKSEAITQAGKDADSKVNSAKTELNNKIDLKASKTDVYTKSETYTKAQTDSAINVAKEEINLNVSTKYETKESVETKINNIEVGGRNILTGTATKKSIAVNASTSYVVFDPYTTYNKKTLADLGFKADDEVTISFDWNIAKNGSLNEVYGNFRLEWKGINSSGSDNQFVGEIKRPVATFSSSNKSGHVVITTKLAANTVKAHTLRFRIDNSVLTFTVSNVKVEKGNKATDFTPAPEDVDSAINSKANSTDVYKKSETYTKSETDSKIKVAKDEINLGVSSTYETKTNVESKISTAKTEVTTTAKNYADTKKQEAISTASSDATTKANNVKNTLTPLIEAKAEKTDVYKKSETYTKTETDSAINVAKEEINLNVSTKYETKESVETKISNSKTEAINTSKSYADTKKTEAINTAATDATNKVNSAKNELNTAINKKANSTDVYKKTEVYTKSETDSAINVAKDNINLNVSNTYETKTNVTTKVNNAKNEAINSANTTTTEKLKSYSTTEKMNSAINLAKNEITSSVSSTYLSKGDAKNTYATKSTLTQTENSIVAKFSTSGGYNLLKDSGFLTSSLNTWAVHGHNNPTGGVIEFLTYNQNWGFPDRSVHTCQIRLSNQSGIEYGIKQKINTTIGKKYTVSFYTSAHRVTQGRVIVRTASGSWVNNLAFQPHLYNGGNANIDSWQLVTLTFTATDTVHFLNICINTALDDGYMWVAKPQICEGEVALPYSINPSEIYEGNTQIDATGITVFNGGLRIKNNSDETVFSGDSKGNLKILGQITTQGNNGKLELASNTLKGFVGNSSANPTYASGIWNPNGAGNVGYVSVGETNALTGDNNGCLFMSPVKNDIIKKAVLQYSRNKGDITGTIEFSDKGSVSLVSKGSSNGTQYGLWCNPEGYVYPYNSKEWLGSNTKRWDAGYFNKAYGNTWNQSALIADAVSVASIENGLEPCSLTGEETYKVSDFTDFIKGLNFGIYKLGGASTCSVADTTKDEVLTCTFAPTSTYDLRNDKVSRLFIQDNYDREGNFEQNLNLNTYWSALGVVTQELLRESEELKVEIDELKNENLKLKERLKLIEEKIGL